MKTKYLIITSGIFVLTILAEGCVKHPLETEPAGNYTTQNYWRN